MSPAKLDTSTHTLWCFVFNGSIVVVCVVAVGSATNTAADQSADGAQTYKTRNGEARRRRRHSLARTRFCATATGTTFCPKASCCMERGTQKKTDPILCNSHGHHILPKGVMRPGTRHTKKTEVRSCFWIPPAHLSTQGSRARSSRQPRPARSRASWLASCSRRGGVQHLPWGPELVLRGGAVLRRLY